MAYSRLLWNRLGREFGVYIALVPSVRLACELFFSCYICTNKSDAVLFLIYIRYETLSSFLGAICTWKGLKLVLLSPTTDLASS